MANEVEKKEKMVRIKLPREKGGPDSVFVSINEKTWLLKVGEPIEVPECVANAIDLKERMEEENYEFLEGVQR